MEILAGMSPRWSAELPSLTNTGRIMQFLNTPFRRMGWIAISLLSLWLPVWGQGCNFAFVATPGYSTDLTSGDDYCTGAAPCFQVQGITDSGQLIGFVPYNTPLTGAVRSNGVFSVFRYPSGASVAFRGGNNKGQLVGYTTADNSDAVYFGNEDHVLPGWHGVIWSDGKFNVFDYPGSAGTTVYGINDKGDFVGAYVELLGNQIISHAFKVTAGVPARLFTPELVDISTAYGINNAGQIVGTVHTYNSKGASSTSMFVMSPDGTYQIPSPPGATILHNSAVGINDAGDIVGGYYVGGNSVPSGFLLRNGVLETIVAPNLAEIDHGAGTIAYGINNGGQIVGSGGSLLGFVTSCQPPVPKVISAVSESGGTVGLNGSAPVILLVKVTDAAGFGAHGIPVSFTVSSGTGALSGSSAVTEADGTASTIFTPSSSLSAAAVRASVSGLPPATFSLVPPPSITSALSIQATVGNAFTYQMTATNSPTSYSASGLPAGLTLNTTTGLISGMPTTAGSFTVALTGTNAAGTSAAVTLKLTVVLDPSSQLKAAAGDAQTGVAGKALSNPLVVQLTGNGGAPLAGVPVAFAVTSGSATLSASSVPTASDGTDSVTGTLVLSSAVTVTATVAGLPSIQFHLTAILPPTVAIGGVVNAASNQLLLAPGALATVYGANFGTPATVFANMTGTGTNGGVPVGVQPGTSAIYVAACNFAVPAGSDFVVAGGSYLASFGSGTNSVHVALYADSGGKPGALLEIITLVNVLTPSAAAVPFTSAASPTLLGGHQYWLAVSMANPSTSTSYWWFPSKADPGLTLQSVSGSGWGAGSSNRLGFTILASPKAGGLPLPTSLSGVTVSLGGRTVPLMYVGPSQINFQVPYETTPGTSTMVVTANGVAGSPVSVSVAAAAPGIFVYGNDWAVVLNQDYSLNGPSNSAKAGSDVMLYGTGAGAASPAVATGSGGPASPLSTVTNVIASINGVPATVSFQGLAPNFVGLLQVNLQVPALPTGSYLVQITAGGAKSNSAWIAVTP